MPQEMPNLYNLIFTLTGHTDGITCLSFAPQGDLLASSGDDRNIIIWDVELGKILHCIIARLEKMAFVGGADGLLAIVENIEDWEPVHSVLTGVQAPVYAIAIDLHTNHLAIRVSSEVHIAKEVSYRKYATFKILPMPPELPSPLKPKEQVDNWVRARSLTFKNFRRELVVAYLNHGVVCWHIGSDSDHDTQRWHISPIHLHQLIGNGALSPDESLVLLSNLSDGLDLYAVGHNHPVKSFKFSLNGGVNLPVQVSFVEHGWGILGGSSEGNVHVWGLASTESRQVLEHDGCVVQAVAAFDYFGYSIIVTTTSRDPHLTCIKLWRSNRGIEWRDCTLYITSTVALQQYWSLADLALHAFSVWWSSLPSLRQILLPIVELFYNWLKEDLIVVTQVPFLTSETNLVPEESPLIHSTAAFAHNALLVV
ncbi:WD40-repeat-containing domain protein [Suillus cothurnatus]|nr:WD40-repeat-containing domain protein [Suillus cothurnatus]